MIALRRSLVLLIVLGLVLGAAGAVEAQGKRGRGNAPPAPLGKFMMNDQRQTVVGDHLSFNWSGAGIEDFAAGGQTLFSLTVAGGAGDEDHEDDDDDRDAPPLGARSTGSKFQVRSANYSFVAHDNPSAVGKLETKGLITITFADSAVLARGRGDAVQFTVGNVSGTLRGDDLLVSGRTVTAKEEALVFLDEARGSFDRKRSDISEAIAKRHVGAEATINADDLDITEDLVSYGNVTMRTLKAEQGDLTVEIEGHGFEGRVIVLNVDGRVIGAESAQKLQIMLDNESVRPASNFTDALDPDDDGYEPEYYLVYDPGAHAFQLVVTVPHYSVHTLSVTTILEVLQPSVVVGVLAGVALLVPAAVLLFRRK